MLVSYRPLARLWLRPKSPGEQRARPAAPVRSLLWRRATHPVGHVCKSTLNALPALIARQSAFGTNELTTQLVLRLVDDDELLACGCVCKVLERTVDDARDGNIFVAVAASPDQIAVARRPRPRRRRRRWHAAAAAAFYC